MSGEATAQGDAKLPPAGLWLLAATLVTTIGNGMHTLTVGKLLYDETGSAAAFGGVIIFEQVLASALQFVAGPWVDRGDPQKTCLQVELIRGLFVCAAAAMLAYGGNVYVWVMLMTLVIRVAVPFYRAAMFAIGPAAVPAAALGRFNGYSNIGLQGGQLIGVALAGPVLAYWGAPAAFLINGVTFLFSGLAVGVVRMNKAEKAPASLHTGFWRQLWSGWGEILMIMKRDAGLAWHIGLCALDAIAVHLFNLALLPIVAARYQGSSYWLSVVDGAFAVGAIATAPLVPFIEKRLGIRGGALLGLAGQMVCFAALAISEPTWLTLVTAFGVGAANTISWTVLMTALQIRSKGPIKGRIGTVRNVATSALTAVLVPLVAKLEGVSVEAMLLASAGISAVFVVVALVMGSKRFLGEKLLVTRKEAA